MESLILIAMLSMQDETALVRQSKAGNQQAFEELELDCREKVSKSVLKLVKNTHTAQDIYQQGLSKSWKKIKKFKGESRFSTWLCRICYNLAYDGFRKERREPTDSLDALKEANPNIERFFIKSRTTEESGFKNLDIAELGKRLDKTLDHLSPEHREALELFAREDLSYEEIAKKARIPVGTVMSRLFYAKRNAKKRYKILAGNEKRQ